MSDPCTHCKGKAISPRPPKFSIEDKYGNYRRKVKRDELIKEGLI
jgi:rRNA maturation protein Nop10